MEIQDDRPEILLQNGFSGDNFGRRRPSQEVSPAATRGDLNLATRSTGWIDEDLPPTSGDHYIKGEAPTDTTNRLTMFPSLSDADLDTEEGLPAVGAYAVMPHLKNLQRAR